MEVLGVWLLRRTRAAAAPEIHGETMLGSSSRVLWPPDVLRSRHVLNRSEECHTTAAMKEAVVVTKAESNSAVFWDFQSRLLHAQQLRKAKLPKNW